MAKCKTDKPKADGDLASYLLTGITMGFVSIEERQRLAAAISEHGHLRRIILGLFNPLPDGHKSGCLVNDPHISPRGPCICGYAEVAGEYLWALREAKKIAADRFGKDEVDNAPRLKEPQKLIEAATP